MNVELSKREIAIKFIKDNEPSDGYAVANSGGKDSGVLRDLILKSGIEAMFYYEDTGIDPPELVKHIREHNPETFFLRPPRFKGHRSLFGMMVAKGIPPYRGIRWC